MVIFLHSIMEQFPLRCLRYVLRALHLAVALTDMRDAYAPLCTERKKHSRTQGLRSSCPTVEKLATLESPDLKSENIGLPVELRIPCF